MSVYAQAFDDSSQNGSYVEVSTMGDGALEFSISVEQDLVNEIATINEEEFEYTDTIESPCMTPPTQQRKLVSFRSPKTTSSVVEEAVAEDESFLSRSSTRNSSFGPTVAGQAGQSRKRHLMRLYA